MDGFLGLKLHFSFPASRTSKFIHLLGLVAILEVNKYIVTSCWPIAPARKNAGTPFLTTARFVVSEDIRRLSQAVRGSKNFLCFRAGEHEGCLGRLPGTASGVSNGGVGSSIESPRSL